MDCDLVNFLSAPVLGRIAPADTAYPLLWSWRCRSGNYHDCDPGVRLLSYLAFQCYFEYTGDRIRARNCRRVRSHAFDQGRSADLSMAFLRGYRSANRLCCAYPGLDDRRNQGSFQTIDFFPEGTGIR